jgi:hypothetical protein
MEILWVLGLIFLIALIYVGGGVFGWLLKGVEVIFNFLLEGNLNCVGCFVKLLIVIFVIYVLVGVIGL